MLADPRTNTVLLRTSSRAKMELAKSLVERLDMPADAAQANMRVIYLRNAEAVKLVEVLRAVLAGDQAGGAGGVVDGLEFAQAVAAESVNSRRCRSRTSKMRARQSTQPLQSSQQGQQGPVTINAGGAIIAADPATNSLIVTAPEPVYRNIRAVIDKLDSRRAQVYIESLIVEVSADKAAELGIQWQFLSPSNSGGNQVIGGTNLPARGSGSNIIDATANILSLGTGLNIGLVRNSNVIGQDGTATSVVNLGLLARALETHAGANVKATPNLLTLDNEEARIIIGQNVPFVTGQYTGVRRHRSIEPVPDGRAQGRRHDAARTAAGVRGRRRQDADLPGGVRQCRTRVLAAGLVTSRRAIESNVLVDDGQVVVLGGLIEDRVEGSESKVPILGDIPLLGRLFRYDTRSHRRTNLLVFLRPTIIKDPKGSWDVTANRYDYMRAVSTAQLPDDWPLPQYGSPAAEPCCRRARHAGRAGAAARSRVDRAGLRRYSRALKGRVGGDRRNRRCSTCASDRRRRRRQPANAALRRRAWTGRAAAAAAVSVSGGVSVASSRNRGCSRPPLEPVQVERATGRQPVAGRRAGGAESVCRAAGGAARIRCLRARCRRPGRRHLRRPRSRFAAEIRQRRCATTCRVGSERAAAGAFPRSARRIARPALSTATPWQRFPLRDMCPTGLRAPTRCWCPVWPATQWRSGSVSVRRWPR